MWDCQVGCCMSTCNSRFEKKGEFSVLALVVCNLWPFEFATLGSPLTFALWLSWLVGLWLWQTG